ncbi:MAG TPA: hypothetical protein VLO31_03465 [Cryobacterium sp.]|nr:hypothetical protein [Cryobacterium sp.]
MMTLRRATLRRMLLVPLLLVPSLALTACVPWQFFPSPTASPSATGPATPAPTPTATPAPAPAPTSTGTSPRTPPPDETNPPQAGDRVISSRISQDWVWPGPDRPIRVSHDNPVPIAPPPEPPIPYLYTIGVGAHPSNSPPYDQMSFRFKGGFPGYDLMFVPELDGDASGLPIPLPGTSRILRVVFNVAQAHTEQGEVSVVSAPPAFLGLDAITRYAPAGDFEGYVTYGIGVGRPMDTVPQTPVRVYEVEKIEQGEHLYVVAIQIDSTMWR